MSRESKVPDISQLPALQEQVIFHPTAAMRTLKAKLLTRSKDNPLLDFNSMSQADVVSLTGHQQLLTANWNKPGFQDWLFNRDENSEKLEELFSQALESMQSILRSEDVKTASAKVNIFKILVEMRKNHVEKDPLADMTKEDLEKFLEKSGVRVEKQIILEANK